jgi:putative transposase
VAELREACGVEIYSYCLMPNHVHLVIYAQHVMSMDLFVSKLAELHGHPLPAGRCVFPARLPDLTHKLVTIESVRHRYACARYVDLNPVMAGLVKRPEDYRWSSYRTRIGLESCPWLDADPCLLALAQTDEELRARYRAFVEEGTPQRLLESIGVGSPNLRLCAGGD